MERHEQRARVEKAFNYFFDNLYSITFDGEDSHGALFVGRLFSATGPKVFATLTPEGTVAVRDKPNQLAPYYWVDR